MPTRKYNKFHWVSIKDLTEPANHSTVIIYRDYWWITNEDETEALFYGPSPQCNENKAIADRVHPKLEQGGKLTKIPLAFVRINPRDY